MKTIRKGAAIILAALVVFFTVVSILAIWDFIDIEDVFRKSVTTLFILFVAAAVMLFLFAVVFKQGGNEAGSGDAKRNNPPTPPPMS